MDESLTARTETTRRRETGVEELRRIVRVCDQTRESAFDGLTAEGVLRLVRACWASPWDIYPDELTPEEAGFAAERGELHASTNERLNRRFGGGQ